MKVSRSKIVANFKHHDIICIALIDERVITTRMKSMCNVWKQFIEFDYDTAGLSTNNVFINIVISLVWLHAQTRARALIDVICIYVYTYIRIQYIYVYIRSLIQLCLSHFFTETTLLIWYCRFCQYMYTSLRFRFPWPESKYCFRDSSCSVTQTNHYTRTGRYSI